MQAGSNVTADIKGKNRIREQHVEIKKGKS